MVISCVNSKGTFRFHESKCKGKFVPVLFLTEHHGMKVYWGVEYDSTISWHLMEVSDQFHAPAALPPG